MLARRHALLAITLVVASTAPTVGQTIPAAAANDNRTPAGILRDGVLSLHLEMRPAVWYPEEEGKAHLIVGAFAEEGHTPQIPGPMVRVPEGTEIAASIHNLLDHTIYVHGLNPRTETSSASPLPSGPTDPAFAADPPNAIEIPAGALREIRFRSGPPGSYYYWASNDRHSLVM